MLIMTHQSIIKLLILLGNGRLLSKLKKSSVVDDWKDKIAHQVKMKISKTILSTGLTLSVTVHENKTVTQIPIAIYSVLPSLYCPAVSSMSGCLTPAR